MTKWSDVCFTFEEGDDVVKVPAHKDILAASSPVFDAMFNGDLKENGDVKIVDASSSVFKEFLQFFYNQHVNLTINNIAEVLKLVDKYDVAACYPVCGGFLIDHLVIDDILWGLYLAIKFHLVELKEYCTRKIQENFIKVWAMFEIGDDKIKVCPISGDRFVPDEDAANIFQHVFVFSKNMVFNQLRESTFSLCLINPQFCEMITECEIFQFQLSAPMIWTDIFFSKVFKSNEPRNAVNHSFELSIESNRHGILYSSKIELNESENHIKLENPIKTNNRSETFAIIMKSSRLWESHYTYQAKIPEGGTTFAPNVNVYFPEVRKLNCSLISHLCFEWIKPPVEQLKKKTTIRPRIDLRFV